MTAFALVLLPLLVGCDPKDCNKPGEICTWFGTPELAGVAEEGTFRRDASTFWVVDVAFHPDGWPVILDWNNHRLLTLDNDENVHILTGTGGELGDGPEGPADEAQWNHPTDLTFLSDGSVVMAAWHNSRIVKFDKDFENAEFLAGTGARDFGGDGGPADAAMFDLPCGVRADADDNIYVADMANQRIRKIDAEGIVSTVAGTGEHGFNGDGTALETMLANPALQRAEPAAKMELHDGSLYFADTHNGRIRRLDLEAGTIETVAGKGETPPASDNGQACTEGCGYSGDGGDATDAELNTPSDVAVADDGTIYIADTDNSCVRRVTPDGTIDTFAGTCGEAGYFGDGKKATKALLNRPFGVALDADGNLYISDTYNSAIRKVIPE